MRVLSSRFYDRLKADKRNYHHTLEFAFRDGSKKTVDDSLIWNGGFSFDSAVSSDSSFGLGAVIAGKVNIILCNLYDDFPDSLVFEKAQVVAKLWIDLDGGDRETLTFGEFTVIEATYTGSLITLSCLDNLHKFDKAYTTDLTFPAKIKDIFYDSCQKCGVVARELNDTENTVVPDRGYNPELFYWSQLFDIKRGSSSSYANISAGARDGYYLVQGTATMDGRVSLPTDAAVTQNHVYMLYGLDNTNVFRWSDTISGTTIIARTEKIVIFRALSTGNVRASISFNKGAADNFELHMKLTDLTAMTGSGEEPTSVTDSKIDFVQRYADKHPEYSSIGIVRNDLYTPPAGIGDCYDYMVNLDPDKRDNLTHRQVLSYIAQICGRFVTVDEEGHAGMNWYRFARLYDAESDIASDSFDERTRRVHKLTSIGSLSVGIDPIVITGVRINGRYKVTTDGKEEEKNFSVLAGNEGYVITIADNPFIRTPSDAEYILGWLGPDLIGKTFRTANVSHLSNPAIEAGDVAYVKDAKGRYHPILVSSTKFRSGQMQQTVSAAETPVRNSAERNSALAKTYTDLLQRIDREKSSRELAIEDLNDRIGEGVGLYFTQKTDVDGGKILYMHDKPKLDESGTVWIISKYAMAVTTDPDITIVDGVITDASTYQYGFTSGGNLLANLISAISIQAENIRLYGDMTVFVNGEANAASGGKIGFGLGRSGWGETKGIHLLSVNAMAEVIATTDGARISYGDNSSVMALDKSTQLYYKTSNGAREYYMQANEDRAELRGQNLNTSTGYLTRVFAGTTSAGAQCVGKANNRVASLYLEDGIVGMYAGTTSANSTTYSSRIFVSEDNGARIWSNKNILMYAAGAKARLESEDEVLISYCIPKGDNDWTYYPRFVADSLGAHLKYGNSTRVEATSTGITLDSASAVSASAGSSFGVSVNGTGKIDIDPATTSIKYNSSNRLEINSLAIKMFAGSTNIWAKSGASGASDWTITSDRRKKKNIKSDIDGDLIDLLNPVSFEWKEDDGYKQVGLIAQEVQEVIPEIVSEEPGSEEHYLGVAYTSLIPFLIKKCQTQQQQINDLEARLSRLEAMINA